jgi:hypothetical protein
MDCPRNLKHLIGPRALRGVMLCPTGTERRVTARRKRQGYYGRHHSGILNQLDGFMKPGLFGTR